MKLSNIFNWVAYEDIDGVYYMRDNSMVVVFRGKLDLTILDKLPCVVQFFYAKAQPVVYAVKIDVEINYATNSDKWLLEARSKLKLISTYIDIKELYTPNHLLGLFGSNWNHNLPLNLQVMKDYKQNNDIIAYDNLFLTMLSWLSFPDNTLYSDIFLSLDINYYYSCSCTSNNNERIIKDLDFVLKKDSLDNELKFYEILPLLCLISDSEKKITETVKLLKSSFIERSIVVQQESSKMLLRTFSTSLPGNMDSNSIFIDKRKHLIPAFAYSNFWGE